MLGEQHLKDSHNNFSLNIASHVKLFLWSSCAARTALFNRK